MAPRYQERDRYRGREKRNRNKTKAASQSPIATLPAELHLMIFDRLDTRSATWLSLTCDNLYHVFTPKPRAKSQRLALLTLEHLGNDTDATQQGGRYVCFHSHRVKDRSDFGRKQTTGSRRKGLNLSHAEKRFCLECGIKFEIYHEGTKVTLMHGSLLCVHAHSRGSRRGWFALRGLHRAREWSATLWRSVMKVIAG